MLVEGSMKRDGRTLDHQTLEEMRCMAVQRVREGERPAAVMASFGLHRTVIYKWLNAAAGRGRGLRALRSTRATGRPRTLTPAQERQVFRWVNGRDPRQYGLDFGLWTRRIVALLIERKFGVRLGVTAVGALLAKLGLTPQKPLQRAYQRDPQAIERWQREIYPALAGRAKGEGADIFFWDESGFRADAVHGKTWGRRGETPIVTVTDSVSRCPLRLLYFRLLSNTERPHEALAMKTPSETYSPSLRPYLGLPELTYPLRDRDVLITADGVSGKITGFKQSLHNAE